MWAIPITSIAISFLVQTKVCPPWSLKLPLWPFRNFSVSTAFTKTEEVTESPSGGVTFIADHPLLFSALVRRWLFRAEEAQNVSTDLTGSIKGGENAKHEVGINLMLCNVYVDDTIWVVLAIVELVFYALLYIDMSRTRHLSCTLLADPIDSWNSFSAVSQKQWRISETLCVRSCVYICL